MLSPRDPASGLDVHDLFWEGCQDHDCFLRCPRYLVPHYDMDPRRTTKYDTSDPTNCT